jgi:hypothetical protein
MSKAMLEQLRAFMESPEGEIAMKKFGEKMKREAEQKTANRLRIEKMFTDQESFDNLMHKICDMHDDAYDDACYKKGYQPHPNNVLYAMMNVFEEHGSDIPPIDGLTESFPSELIEYRGWQIAYTFGQGTCISVYKNKELMVRL